MPALKISEEMASQYVDKLNDLLANNYCYSGKKIYFIFDLAYKLF